MNENVNSLRRAWIKLAQEEEWISYLIKVEKQFWKDTFWDFSEKREDFREI